MKRAQSFCVSACIWANLWVLLSPQPETGPSFLTTWTKVVGTFTTTSPHHYPSFWFHSHFHTFRFPPSHHALCSLATKRAKEEFQRVCNVSMWLCLHRVLNPDFRLPSFGGIAAVAAGGGGNRRCHGCVAAQGLSNMGH